MKVLLCSLLMVGMCSVVIAQDKEEEKSIFTQPFDEYLDALDYYIVIDDTNTEKTKVSVLRLSRQIGKVSVIDRIEIKRIDNNILHINFKPSYGLDAWYSSQVLAEIYDENRKNSNILTVSTKKPKSKLFNRNEEKDE